MHIEDSGAVRGVLRRYGGIVKSSARSGSGVTVATLLPRGVSRVQAQLLDVPAHDKAPAGDAPSSPPSIATRLASWPAELDEETKRAARACADALGAQFVDPAMVRGEKFAPDFYIAFGVDGSAEHNAAFRNSRLVVAIIADASAPISQIADYILIGEVGENARALVAAL